MANDNNDQDVADILRLLESSEEAPTDPAAVVSLGDLEDISPFLGDDINFAQLLHASPLTGTTNQHQSAGLAQQQHQQQHNQQRQGLQQPLLQEMGTAASTASGPQRTPSRDPNSFTTSTLDQRPPSAGAMSPVGGDLQSLMALLDAPTAHAEQPEFPFLGDAGFLGDASPYIQPPATQAINSQSAPLKYQQRQQEQQQQQQQQQQEEEEENMDDDEFGSDEEEEEQQQQQQADQQKQEQTRRRELASVKTEAALASEAKTGAEFGDGRGYQHSSGSTAATSSGATTASQRPKGVGKTAAKATPASATSTAAKDASSEPWQHTLTSPTMALDPRKMTTRPAASSTEAAAANGQGNNSGAALESAQAAQSRAGRREAEAGGARESSSSAGSIKQAGQRKRPHNKASADKYRRRKKERFETMQQDVEQYTRENTELAVKASRLENEKAFLCTLLESAIRNSADPVAALLNVPQELITPAMLPAQVNPELFEKSKRVMQQFVEDNDAQVATRVASLEGAVQELVRKLDTQPATSTSSSSTGEPRKP